MLLNDEELAMFASTLVMLKLLVDHRKGCLSLSFPVIVEEMMLSMTDVFVSELKVWGVTWDPRLVADVTSCELKTLICSVPTIEVWIIGIMNAIKMHALLVYSNT